MRMANYATMRPPKSLRLMIYLQVFRARSKSRAILEGSEIWGSTRRRAWRWIRKMISKNLIRYKRRAMRQVTWRKMLAAAPSRRVMQPVAILPWGTGLINCIFESLSGYIAQNCKSVLHLLLRFWRMNLLKSNRIKSKLTIINICWKSRINSWWRDWERAQEMELCWQARMASMQ